MLFSPTAAALTNVIPAGSSATMSAGAGQSVTSGAESIYYNPANLSLARNNEFQGEFSYAKATYAYTHPDAKFSPVTVDVGGTPIIAGYSLRPLTGLTLGVLFFPSAVGKKQVILDVPLKISGKMQANDIINTDTAFVLGFGGSYRILSGLSLGLSVLLDYESHTTQLYAVEDVDPFIDAAYHGLFTQILLGARAQVCRKNCVVAGTLALPVTKTYEGSLNFLGADGPIGTIEYEPMVIGLAGEYRIGKITPFGDYRYAMYSAGNSIVRQGFGPEPASYSYIDTHTVVVGGKFQLARNRLVQGGVGFYPANTAAGTTGTAADGSDDVGGIRFGKPEMVGRTVFSGGYRQKFRRSDYFDIAMLLGSGSNSAPQGTPGEGTYQFSLFMLTAAGGYHF